MKTLATTFLAIISISLWSQGQVGINTNNPDPSAVLDIQSDSLGVLFPRMTTTQINNINNPANGLQVFNTDLQELFFFNASTGVWQQLSSIWKLNGDSIYYNLGNVGIGTTSPRSQLHIEDNNPRFQMTNGNDYSIIIDLDESDNDVYFYNSNNNINLKLFTFSSDAKLGIGDVDPEATLHLLADTPSFKITNGDNYSIIIDLDESDNDIKFNGEIGNTQKRLFSVTQQGNFAIGTHHSDTTLHIEDISPFIKFTNDNDIDFLLGLKNTDNSFSLNTPSIALDFINATSGGDLSLSGTNAVNISPGVTSPFLTLYNPNTSDSIQIEVDSTGGLNIPHTSLADRENFITLNFSDETYNNSTSKTLDLTSSTIAVASNTVYSVSTINDYVSFTSSGYYQITYALSLNQIANSSDNPTIDVELESLNSGGTSLSSIIHKFGVYSQKSQTKSLTKILYFDQNDKLKINVGIDSYANLNHNTELTGSESFIEIIKISN